MSVLMLLLVSYFIWLIYIYNLLGECMSLGNLLHSVCSVFIYLGCWRVTKCTDVDEIRS